MMTKTLIVRNFKDWRRPTAPVNLAAALEQEAAEWEKANKDCPTPEWVKRQRQWKNG